MFNWYYDIVAYDFSLLYIIINFSLHLLVCGSYLPACKFIKQSSLTRICHQNFMHAVKDTFTQTFNKYQRYKSDPAFLFPTFKTFSCLKFLEILPKVKEWTFYGFYGCIIVMIVQYSTLQKLQPQWKGNFHFTVNLVCLSLAMVFVKKKPCGQ